MRQRLRTTKTEPKTLVEEITRLKRKAAGVNVQISQWERVSNRPEARRLQIVRDELLLQAAAKEAELKRLLETLEP